MKCWQHKSKSLESIFNHVVYLLLLILTHEKQKILCINSTLEIRKRVYFLVLSYLVPANK